VTGRAAAIQGGLAALGLITAAFTWQREPERAPGEVSVIDAGKKDVTRVHYEDESATLELERRDDAVWVHLADHPKSPATIQKDAKKDDKAVAVTPPAPTPPVNPPRDMRGSEAAEKLYDQFAPLRSPRAFGVLDAAKLKELGLDAPKRKLIVNFKGDTREYAIGQPAGSTGEAFLRDARDGRVYLMPHGMASDLSAGSSRLVDRKLHGFEPVDFDKVVLTVGGKKRELVQTQRENVHTVQMAPAAHPDKPDQMAKNWHEMLWRSFPMEVLGKGEVPKEGAPSPALRVDYYDGKKTVGWIEIAKGPAPAVSESGSAPPAQPTLFARTERTAGWVKLRPNPQLMTDADKVVTAQ
jgi:hypothetical protein